MKFKFSIRFVLLFVTAIALSIFSVQKYWEWKYADRIIGISLEKADFSMAGGDSVLTQTEDLAYEVALEFQNQKTFYFDYELSVGRNGEMESGLSGVFQIRAQNDEQGLQIQTGGGATSMSPDRPIIVVRTTNEQVDSQTWKVFVESKILYQPPMSIAQARASMKGPTVYAALVASVFASLPAVDLQFITFSTEVADLSDFVDDPLALLTEVRIGGGTHIALGLRAAREAIRVPNRAMVVLITDFHEGVSVPELLGEVRSLATSGAKLIGLAALDDKAKTVYHTGIAPVSYTHLTLPTIYSV